MSSVTRRPCLASLGAALLHVSCSGSGEQDRSSARDPTPTSLRGGAAHEGVTIYAYGHSYLASTATPRGRPPYLSLVAERFNMRVVDRAVGGSTAAQIAGHVLSTLAWEPGSRDVVVVESVIKDVASYGRDQRALAAFSDSWS